MRSTPQPTRKRMVTQYNEEFVAQVMAEYAKGTSPTIIAKLFDISPSLIDRWASKYGIRRGATLSETARERIGAKLLELLENNIDAEIRIVGQTRNQEWMDRQGAGDLALLFATIHDKSVHMLSSMQHAAKQQEYEQNILEDADDEDEEGWDDTSETHVEQIEETGTDG